MSDGEQQDIMHPLRNDPKVQKVMRELHRYGLMGHSIGVDGLEVVETLLDTLEKAYGRREASTI